MSASADTEEHAPPYVGALLRLAWQRAREAMAEAVRAAGFDDLGDAQLALFTYPLPDGVRPAELARRAGISRQAANHLLVQLERLGYIERRAGGDGGRRLVHLTERGQQLGETLFASLRALEAEWSAQLGPERFREWRQILRQLAASDAAKPAGPLAKPPGG